MKKNHLLALSFILSVLILKAQDTKNVLFIGNSYTYYNNLPEIIEQLALSNGDTFTFEQNTPGFYMLIQHAENTKSIDLINKGNWDHVVLQEFSTLAAYTYLDFYDGADQLLQLINPESTCINKAIFYMTWGRENSTTYPYSEHQQLTTEAYNTMSTSFETEVSPVGAAWKKVRDDNDPIDLYDPDGSHPSYAGSYLAACVFYATIFDKTPIGLSFKGSLSNEDANYLQQKAFEAYTEYVSLGLIHTGSEIDTITDVYRAQLNNSYFELNSQASNNSINTSFDFTFTGSSALTNVNTALEYIISQEGNQVANGSVPISMTITPNQCVSKSETYPLNIDLSNVGNELFHLEIWLDGNIITDYYLSKTVTPLAETTWKLAAIEKALGEGATQRNPTEWWYNSTGDITTRACQFDDQYVFNTDGTFQNILDGSTWLESWQGAPEGCGSPIAPHDGTANATWSYSAAESSITISGFGAYLGLPGVHNNGKLNAPNDAVSPITYPVVFEGDIMYAFLDYGEGVWRFVFEKELRLSTNEVERNGPINFFPNPATTEITIQTAENIDELTIYDLTGKKLISQKAILTNDIVNVSKLKSGLYILETHIGHKVSVKKLAIR